LVGSVDWVDTVNLLSGSASVDLGGGFVASVLSAELAVHVGLVGRVDTTDLPFEQTSCRFLG
jgi:purine nucleoside permease